MLKYDVIIIIPLYKETLEWYEELSLQRNISILKNHPIAFIAPDDLHAKCMLDYPDIPVIRFPNMYFKNIPSYSKLMLSPDFYKTFFHYKYLLICQTDALVFSDSLLSFCQMNYDYWGAPWPACLFKVVDNTGKRDYLRVGNGGFSLRNIRACYNLLIDNATFIANNPIAEDSVFAYLGKHSKAFRVAPLSKAYYFSGEWCIDKSIKRIGALPFGCHNWYRFSKDSYLKIFRQIGFDISTHADDMSNLDNVIIKEYIHKYLVQRLQKRISSNLPISNFLDKNSKYVIINYDQYTLPLVETLAKEINLQAVFTTNDNEQAIAGITAQKLDSNSVRHIITYKYQGYTLLTMQPNDVLLKISMPNEQQMPISAKSFIDLYKRDILSRLGLKLDRI